ncbi:hypothetical protein Barb6XT_03222 [Bacteroidales bacterium Barb6XT]|nr:hypothetical protein Barb6XT_03222 [Bacteroidales bacterium Barb6XT]
MQDFSYSNIADKVANELLQCSIDFFNDSQSKKLENNYHEKAVKLVNLAEEVAVGSMVKDRIKANLQTLEDMKDREINQAIALLQSVKNAYEDNERKIRAQARELQENDFEIRMGMKSINWISVNANIQNSINWDKVVELIKEEITPQNVNAIKNTTNSGKIEEYKKSVNFILGKLGSYRKTKVSYLDWWSSNTSSTTTRTLSSPPRSTYTPKKESWASENPGCVLAIVIAIFIAFIAMFV